MGPTALLLGNRAQCRLSHGYNSLALEDAKRSVELDPLYTKVWMSSSLSPPLSFLSISHKGERDHGADAGSNSAPNQPKRDTGGRPKL